MSDTKKPKTQGKQTKRNIFLDEECEASCGSGDETDGYSDADSDGNLKGFIAGDDEVEEDESNGEDDTMSHIRISRMLDEKEEERMLDEKEEAEKEERMARDESDEKPEPPKKGRGSATKASRYWVEITPGGSKEECALLNAFCGRWQPYQKAVERGSEGGAKLRMLVRKDEGT